MISDNRIDELMQPIIDRQSALNLYVIKSIAQRIKEIGDLLPSDIYKLERLARTGADVKKINAKIAEITQLNKRDIEKLIKKVAMLGYVEAKPFYEAKKQVFVPFEKNKPMQRLVKAIATQTSNEYVNLSRSRAFMLRDLQNPEKLIPTPLNKAYHTIVDEAVQAVQNGFVDYATAMRRTMQQLADSGMRTITYYPEKGGTYTQSMEAAVKRNILTGVRAISQQVQDQIGQEIDADGKEISVHEYPAPDHEPIQGHIFTVAEYEKLQSGEPFKDIAGQEFTAIARPIGEYNCRHFTFAFMIGISKPNYTAKQLQEIIDRNKAGYTDSKGKHYTLYECSQEQRRMEREIRKQKTNIQMANVLGDEAMVEKSKAKLADTQKQYMAFSKACGLPEKPLNLKIAGE